MNKEYLTKWVDENRATLEKSAWYLDECPEGYIDADFFLNYYLIPLIRSNVEYDFPRSEIDVSKLID